MPLAAGLRLGPYEILSAIGAGGMGQAYRARDTQLKREVAIKVLPEPFAQDADRLAVPCGPQILHPPVDLSLPRRPSRHGSHR